MFNKERFLNVLNDINYENNKSKSIYNNRTF